MSYAYPLDSVVTYDALGVPQYDRAVASETLRAILHVMLTDGVFLEEDIDMQVTATGSMSVQVGKGYCVIRGAQKIFSTPEIVQIPASNTLNRIDTIVARLDLNQDVRDVVLDVVKGTPSSTPVAPELTRTSSIWEIGLANVKVKANSSVIAQENITDTRLDTNRCGLVSSLMAFDTTSLYDQIQADLLTFKEINEADFLAWYQSIKDQLSGDVAGNLQLQIDTLNNDLSGRIDTLDNDLSGRIDEKANNDILSDVWNASTTYAVGQYCIYNNSLWKCLVQNIGQTPTEGTYWTNVTVANEIASVNSSLRWFIDNGYLPDPNNPNVELIPIMTSNTTPSGIVSASAETQPAYYAFDGNENTYWYTYGNEGSYVQYKFDQAKCVRKISVQTYYTGSNGLIKKFKVQASNDGSAFIDLTGTIINSNQSDKGESEYTINNSQKYLYYRVYTVESGAYSGWRSIQMYEN